MKTIWVTQRVVRHEIYAETRDACDERWVSFVLGAGYFPVLVPNNAEWIARAIEQQFPCDGILLTGGDDLHDYGGQAPHRDHVELSLLSLAVQHQLPIFGVCRGMQLIAHYFDVALKPAKHQILSEQINIIDGHPQTVNSYHQWQLSACPDAFRVFATDEPGDVIKGIRHQSKPITGIMWHPERIEPYRAADKQLLQQVFS